MEKNYQKFVKHINLVPTSWDGNINWKQNLESDRLKKNAKFEICFFSDFPHVLGILSKL